MNSFSSFSMAILYALVLLFIATTAPLSAQMPDRDQWRNRLRTAAEPFDRFGRVIRSSAEFAAPGIVHIEATQVRAVNPGRAPGRSVPMQVEESGSGVIARLEGKMVVLTNRHVVQGISLDSIKIRTSDRRMLTPTKVTTNEDFDLATVEVAETLSVAVDFGDSDLVGVGDIVLAVGSPFGLDRSLSMGIISAKNRRNIPAAAGEAPRVGFLQLDAAVNPGSSGGPVLNLRGEVVGLITAIATQGGGHEGVAFAIPSKIVLRIASQMVRDESVVLKPHVGLGFDREFPMSDRRQLGIDRFIGARINRVVADSPADQGGLKVGDVILSFDGVEVEDDLHLVILVAEAEVDRPHRVTVNRSGQSFELTVTPTSQISR